MGNLIPPEEIDDIEGLKAILAKQPGFIRIKGEGSRLDSVINMNLVTKVEKVSEDQYKVFFDDSEKEDVHIPIVNKMYAEKIMAYIAVRDKLGGLL